MTSIFKLIEQDVADTLALKGDGTPFFDTIDAKLTHPHYMRYLKDKIFDTFLNVNKPYAILGSGKFGWAFSMYMNGNLAFPRMLNFPGDLRHQPLVDPLVDPTFEGRKFVYVDNSIYKGRTLGQISNYVRDWGGEITHAFVLYDGTYPPHDELQMVPNFAYVYRWHKDTFRVWEPQPKIA